MALSDAQRSIINSVAAALGPGPPNDPDAAKKVKDLLDKYDRRYEKEMRATTKKAGLNMTLPKEVVGGDAVTVFGHVRGVLPGAKFKDRGQLYVSGLHATLMKGIHAPPVKHPDYANGAYSIVMSGGYVDDEDMGESFWYTGEGGIDAATKRQIKDQSMERGANAALRNNCDSKTPVRVMRGFVGAPGGGGGGEVDAANGGGGAGASGAGASGSSGGGGGGSSGGKKEKGFVYEGLYVVLQYKQEASKDGPLVCKFLLHGVPGHSTVNTKVEFGIFGGVSTSGRLHAQRLAAASASAAAAAKRTRVDRKDRRAMETAQKVMLSDIHRRYPGPELLCDDVSGGLEPVPIPLVNTVNSEQLPPGFRYIREYEWAPGVLELVAPVLRFVSQEMCHFVRQPENGSCGLAFNRMIAEKDRAMGAALPQGYEPHLEEQYNSAGCLLVTDPCGVHECSGAGCTSAKCRRNMQLTNGVSYPLEVFMTSTGKGWGVRCRDALPAGAFVCAYVGQVISDHMAEVRKGSDHYLFDLDFFAHIYTEMVEKGLDAIQQEIPLHKIPPVLPVANVRQLQAQAAAAVRARKAEAEAAAKAAATGDGGSAAAAEAAPAADAAGPSGRQADGGTAAAAASGGGAIGGGDPVRAYIILTNQPDGVLPPELVPAAARDLAASCSAFAAAAAAGGGGGDDAAAGPSAAAPPAPPRLAAEAAAIAATCEADPGAFYLQQIFTREDGGGGSAAATQPPPPPDAPLAPRSAVAAAMAAASGEDDEFAPILVLDARSCGNVGRFINHSCDGNLTIQAVFAGAYRSTFLYHVGLYASRDIPAGTELTYNYGYHNQAARGGAQYGMDCHCGAPNCVGQLM